MNTFSTRTPGRIVATLGVAALAAVTFTGCSIIDSVFEDGPPKEPQEEHFDKYADAPTSGNIAFAMPTFVPKNATDIDVRLLATSEPGYLIRFESADGVKDGRCEPVDAAPEPAITAAWWPDAVPGDVEDGLLECTEKRFTNPVYVTVVDDIVYGWTSDYEISDDADAPKTTDGTPGTDEIPAPGEAPAE